ncbi:MAG: DNA polymerase III subunit beta [Dehalococcoidia bacterium]|nr:DNA polymerase III subunit beta [Dehalococcoidia bacterium]
MKVSVLQENLQRGLSIVGRAVASRTTLPIASNVLLASDDGQLKLAATDTQSISLTCWIGATIEEEGSITVPSRLLSDFISSLPNEKVDMTLQPRSKQLKLVCARNEATVGGMDAEDFPPIPTIGGGATLKLSAEGFKAAIKQVAFAAAVDDSRPVLTGVDMRVEGNELTLAAADGFRLAVHQLALRDTVDEKMEIIVPARALAELERLLGDSDEDVEMRLNEAQTQVLFRTGQVELVAQLIQGTFPNYGQLIPTEYSSRAVVEVGDFTRETRIASIFARDGSGIVRLQVAAGEDGEPGKLVVSAKAEEIGDNTGEMDATVEGEASKIAFNGKYLQEVLQVLEGGQVALETTSPSSPGVLRPVGNDRYVHVVMPMFVQW